MSFCFRRRSWIYCKSVLEKDTINLRAWIKTIAALSVRKKSALRKVIPTFFKPMRYARKGTDDFTCYMVEICSYINEFNAKNERVVCSYARISKRISEISALLSHQIRPYKVMQYLHWYFSDQNRKFVWETQKNRILFETGIRSDTLGDTNQ